MLVLTRRIGEEIVIDNNIRIKVVAVKGDRIRIGVSAPDSVTVDRAEVHARRMEFVEVPIGSRSDGDSSVHLGLLKQLTADDTLIH